MERKGAGWRTKGMNRDISVSVFDPQFSYENINLRLSTNDDNTFMSWVNERGPKKLSISSADTGALMTIRGIPLGTAVLNNQLVLFTHEDATDHIYVFIVTTADNEVSITGKELFSGNLEFSKDYPIETLVSYESNEIQKVYWTDGLNQPRMINIAADATTIKHWSVTSFDFVSTLRLNEHVLVEKMLGAEGMFAPGVIQYAFTYIRKYGQESSVFYTTPLNYISYKDRGGSPDDKIGNSFRISIYNADANFDYIRIYSIQRTSINATPIVKHLTDLTLKEVKQGKFSKETIYSDNTAYVLPLDLSNDKRILGVKVTNGSYFVHADAANKAVFSKEEAKNVRIVAWRLQGATFTHEDLMSFEDFITKCMSKEGFEREIDGGHIIDNCWNKDYYSTILIEQDLDRYLNSLAKDKLQQEDALWGILVNDTVFYGDLKTGLYEYNIGYSYLDEKWYITQDELTASNVEYWADEIDTVLTYVDNGTSGSTVDPTELLYKGGENIVANTIEQKDNTLFLGNLQIKRPYITADLKTSIQKDLNKEDKIESSTRTAQCEYDYSTGYKYINQLSVYTKTYINDKLIPIDKAVPCGGFKKGDYYRLGVQFQYKSGKWSEPIYINDLQEKNHFGITYDENLVATLTIPTFKGTLSADITNKVLDLGYRRIRGVVVFPSIQDRMCIAQGVGCPTLFTEAHRNTDKDIYAQSSWFFRFHKETKAEVDGADITDANTGAIYPVWEGTLPYMSINNLSDPYKALTPYLLRGTEIQGSFNTENQFKIDNQFLTFHSPDIEFDSQLSVMDYNGFTLKHVGSAIVEKTFSDINIQTETPTISNSGSGFVHKAFSNSSSYGIVSGLFYDDYIVDDDNDGLRQWIHQKSSYKWMVYPWQKNGSLTNDINRPTDKGTRTSVLKKKVISNLRFTRTDWNKNENEDKSSVTLSFNPQLFSSEEPTILKFKDNIYQANIDTLLIPDLADGQYFAFGDEDPAKGDVTTSFVGSNVWFKTFSKNTEQSSNPGIWKWKGVDTGWVNVANTIGDTYVGLVRKKEGVRMKYKSTPHLAFGIANTINTETDGLNIFEICRENKPAQIYGGISMDALMENTWVPCGEPVSMKRDTDTVFEYSYGDTYFQRWDCLKTYAYTKEDINQVVEIGSFMLETRVNIDGRYDRNRGQMNNLNMSPTNFNLHNPVYSQVDNFFSYKIADDDSYKHVSFPNQITWTLTKQAGADVDVWTTLTLANISDFDGDKGAITKIVRQNNQLIAFQDKGISQILYNENVQIASTTGVPIEIANSNKVQGNRYISDTVGCSNKWSIVSTPVGIYFMDSNEKSIYLFNDKITNISGSMGFNTWCKQNIPTSSIKWTTEERNSFRSAYDRINQDVYFINKNSCLAFSEKVNAFTSFYGYDAPFFCNINDIGLWISRDASTPKDSTYYLYQHGTGEYCNFFGKEQPFSMILIGNQDVQLTKTFTNLELKASIDGEGTTDKKGGYTPYIPFDSLEVWNEYQHGISTLKEMLSMKHDTVNGEASLKRKFRIWRCDIPRDNYPIPQKPTDSDSWINPEIAKGIFRTKRHSLDRMRNPWLYLKLQNIGGANRRTEIHDMYMYYFV